MPVSLQKDLSTDAALLGALLRDDRFVVYSSTTGEEPVIYHDAYVIPDFSPDPHCYVCGRHTDHFAEHDSLVGLGLAEYGPHGDVYVTDFARSPHGEVLREFYDRAITRALAETHAGRVSLIKPEGYAITRAYLFGFLIPAASGR